MNTSTMTRRTLLAAGLGVALSTLAGGALTQPAYPTKPIKMIIPFAPGGATDVVGRIVADGLSKELNQPIVIENRGGAGGSIGAAALARSAPDGYTIGLMNVSTHGTNPAVLKSVSYDINADFTPITKLVSFPGVIVVSAKFKATNFQDFMRVMKAEPGRHGYGSSGNGGATHMAMEQFKSMTGLDIIHVPYRGSGPALNDAMSGQLPMMLDSLPSAIGFIKTGQLVPIGLAATERSAQLPNLPTFDELGVKGYAPDFWNGLMAPPNLPEEIQNTLYQATLRALKRPEVKEKLLGLGATISTTTPEGLAKKIRVDAEMWKGVAKFAKISIE